MASSIFPPASFQPLLSAIAKSLISSGATISVAETSTGGLISVALLSVPGASAWYVGGATLYTPVARKAWGGWTDEDAKGYLGPTPELVTGLARSVREQLGTTFCIGESGATGPTVRGKPYTHVAGRTFVSFVSKDGVATRVVDTGSVDRAFNMLAFTEASLLLIRDVLAGEVKLEEAE
ncbi:competence/damage-inducible CinA family protein, partial [Paxillus ammoniavirescens]